MRRSPIRRILTLFLAWPTVLLAHSDPWGDIHPDVSVIDGHFAITFRSSQPDSETYSGYHPVQRMIFTSEGRLVAPRHPLQRLRHWSATSGAGLAGRMLRVGDQKLHFSSGRDRGSLSYVLEEKDGTRSRVRLPWPEGGPISLLEDVAATEDGIAILGKEDARNLLRFYWFDHESTEPPIVHYLGPTACIYHFPVASNIAYAGGRFWVAAVRPGEEMWKLSMWSWKPGEPEGRMEDLDSPADWNSSLSLAAIGDRLCLAYHHPEDGYPGEARILTVFREAR